MIQCTQIHQLTAPSLWEEEVATGLSLIKSDDPNPSPFVKYVIDSLLMLIDPARRSLSKEEWLLLTAKDSLENLSFQEEKNRVVLHTLKENCQGLKVSIN